MKRIIGTVVALFVAAFLSQPAQAEITQTPLGAFQYGAKYGTEGYLSVKTTPGNGEVYTGQMGLMFSEPVYVKSLTIDIFNDGGRAIPGVVYIYTSRSSEPLPFTLALPGTTTYGQHTIDFTANGYPHGLPVDSSYLTVLVYGNTKDQPNNIVYGSSLVAIHPNTAWITADVVSQKKGPDINVNDPDNGFLDRLNPSSLQFFGTHAPMATLNNPWTAVDGRIISNTNDEKGQRDSITWTRNAGVEVGMVATYQKKDGEYPTLGSIGLGFAGEGTDRALPDYVTVIATLEGGGTAEMNIGITKEWVDGAWVTPAKLTDVLQYARYALDDTFVNVTSLTLKFTMPSTTYNYLGITEFQAFVARPIPEPATMSLLVLGGLALLRRR